MTLAAMLDCSRAAIRPHPHSPDLAEEDIDHDTPEQQHQVVCKISAWTMHHTWGKGFPVGKEVTHMPDLPPWCNAAPEDLRDV
jgi:hypothetical protein